MRFKDGVYISVKKIVNGVEKSFSYSDATSIAMHIADEISKEESGKEAWITSIFDGGHKDNSKHYDGDAFDMRNWIITKEKPWGLYTQKQYDIILARLEKELGKDYDVVEHSSHWHIEYDPKTK